MNLGLANSSAFWWSESSGYVRLKEPVNGKSCYAKDANDNDEIVGTCEFSFPNSTPSRYATAVYWPSPSGDPVVLPRMSGYNYYQAPSAFNNNGIVVGQVWNSTKSGLKKSGAIWVRSGTSWTVELLPSLGGGETYPKDVSDEGWVTGHSFVSASRAHAFLWRAGSAMRDLGAIGNESWAEAFTTTTSGEHLIVGSTATSNLTRAVLWRPDQ